MNLNIYLEDRLLKELVSSAKKLHKDENAIISEALKEWLKRHGPKKPWPKSILNFKGGEDFPSGEELRKDFMNLDKDLL